MKSYSTTVWLKLDRMDVRHGRRILYRAGGVDPNDMPTCSGRELTTPQCRALFGVGVRDLSEQEWRPFTVTTARR